MTARCILQIKLKVKAQTRAIENRKREVTQMKDILFFHFAVPRAPPRDVEAVFNATMAHISWSPPKVFPGN